MSESGIRIYCKTYCNELFPVKWKQYEKVLPWFVVSGKFKEVLDWFFANGTFVAKVLDQENSNVCMLQFKTRNQGLELPLRLSCLDGAFKVATAPEASFRLLNEREARAVFQEASVPMQLPWDTLKATVTKLIDEMYREDLILVQCDSENAGALRVAFEEQESVDLRVRLRLPAPPDPGQQAMFNKGEQSA